MSYTIITYTGDGSSTGPYAINYPLGFLNRTDVQCRVGTEVDGFGSPAYRTITWLNDGVVQSISGAPPGNGVTVKFIRTVSKTQLIHDYQNGAIITEDNLDDSDKQLLMAIEEILDGRFAAPPANQSTDLINQSQLTTAIDALQAEIGALTASQSASIAAAVAALDTEIDSKVAAALAGLNLKSGDRLLQHLYSSSNVLTHFTHPLPFNSTPTTSDGTELFSQTITPKTIGNTISILVQGNMRSGVQSVAPALALFINNTFITSAWTLSWLMVQDAPGHVVLQYDYITTSLAPVTIQVNIGPGNSHAGFAFINDGRMGGQIATLTVDEIGVATEGSSTATPTNGWAGDTIVYSGLSFDTSGQASGSVYMAVSSDGTKVYIKSDSQVIYQYILGSPYNISTAVYAGKSFDATTAGTLFQHFSFSFDGTKLYIYDQSTANSIYEFTLRTAWDISTASVTNSYLNGVVTSDGRFCISADGTHLYVIKMATLDIRQYTLSTAWDITSATFNRASTIIAGTSEPDDIAISPDGKTILMSDHASETVYKYTLSTAWDISTLTYTENIGGLNPPGTVHSAYDIVVSLDGTKLYSLSSPSVIYEYLLT